MAEKRVMLVDDDADCRAVLKVILERLRVRVVEAADGFEALQKARRHPPDLFVMDIRMPGVDGLEACRAIRSEPNLAKVPILVLSGVVSRNQLDELSRLDGMPLYDEYLSKPFDYAAVREIVRRRLGLEEK